MVINKLKLITLKLHNRLIKTKRFVRSRLKIFLLSSIHPRFITHGPIQFWPNVRIRITDGGSIEVGRGVCIEEGVVLHAQKGDLQIGDNVFIGHHSELVAKEHIEIGCDALIAPFVVIRDANHRIAVGQPIREQGFAIAPASIGEDCWLGAHSVITAGSQLGNGTVIGANAVVTGKIQDNAIAVGVPARVMKYRK